MDGEVLPHDAWGPLGSMLSSWRRAGPVGTPPFMVKGDVIWEPGRNPHTVFKCGAKGAWTLNPRILNTPELKGRCLPGVRR